MERRVRKENVGRFISIRTKVLFILFVLLLIPAVLILAQGTTLLQTIQPIEQATLERQRMRFEHLTASELSTLETDAVSWAVWDDFWEYVTNASDPEWQDWRILNIDTFVPEFQNIDFILVVDPSGRVLYQHGDEPGFELEADISDHPLFQAVTERRRLSGFLEGGRNIFAIGASTIHRTNDVEQVGPTNGFYVVGRELNDEMIRRFSDGILADISVAWDGIVLGDKDGGDDGTTLTVAFPLPQMLFGATAPTTSIIESREVFLAASTQLEKSVLLMVAFLLSAALIMIILFEHVVIRPISSFSDQMSRNRRTGKLVPLKTPRPNDEYRQLALTFNGMTEGVNRLRAEFEDVVAHHVKTPLTSIKWSAEAALESTEPERSKRLGEIDALADRTLAYVKDLLRIARVATGGTKIKTAPTPLRATLNEVARDFRPELERTNQTLDMDIAASIYVMADQTLLKEVIYNLLSNAIKYGRGGGRITVTVEEVNGGEVETSFTDDGIGVPAKDRPELFRKFFRATNATGEGTGLGLAMVKEFTEAMGGSVSYKNRSDRGSTFVIRLRKA